MKEKTKGRGIRVSSAKTKRSSQRARTAERATVPSSIRWRRETKEGLEAFMKKNKLTKAVDVIHTAVDKYISEEQIIKLKPVTHKKFFDTAEKVLEEHSDAIEKLK